MSSRARSLAGPILVATLVVAGAWWKIAAMHSAPRANPVARDAARRSSDPALPTEPRAYPNPLEQPPAANASLDAETSVEVRGRLVDPSGAPVADAFVIFVPDPRTRKQAKLQLGTLPPLSDLARLPRTRSGADGRFGLRFGKELLEANSNSRDFIMPWTAELLLIHPGFETMAWASSPFYANGAATRSIGEVTMTPAACITARIVDVQLQPVAGALVDGWPREDVEEPQPEAAALSVLTDEDGRFRLDGFSACQRSFWVSANGFVTHEFGFEATPGVSRDLGSLVLAHEH